MSSSQPPPDGSGNNPPQKNNLVYMIDVLKQVEKNMSSPRSSEDNQSGMIAVEEKKETDETNESEIHKQDQVEERSKSI